ncbi:hypothetical protein RI129_008305 [Pyrocoelia pectoralis]|uniref:MULE transposase domain-containing protein n=1 Tax=Pyrocoelia pectoralis TaxID=417401 RepID=A0AAN7VAZ2_9COLE
MPLNTNDTFDSYKELQDAVDLYEKENRVQFWKRDAKTITSAKHHALNLYKTVQDKELDLKYYILHKVCMHTWWAAISTYKQDCNASITVGLKDRMLVIKNILNNHNHEIPTSEIFRQLPKQRRLSNDNKSNVKKLMRLKVNKKLLQAHLIQQTGNSILLKDLSNIYMSHSSDDISNNNIQKIVGMLTNKYYCTVDVHSEDNKLRGMFFQDENMRKSFDLFPEILFMDGTYKLINIRCPVYVLCIENSFGKTDVVGIGVLMSETTECINWLIQKNNSLKNDPIKKNKKLLYSSYCQLQLSFGKKNQLPFKKMAAMIISLKWRHLQLN